MFFSFLPSIIKEEGLPFTREKHVAKLLTPGSILKKLFLFKLIFSLFKNLELYINSMSKPFPLYLGIILSSCRVVTFFKFLGKIKVKSFCSILYFSLKDLFIPTRTLPFLTRAERPCIDRIPKSSFPL